MKRNCFIGFLASIFLVLSANLSAYDFKKGGICYNYGSSDNDVVVVGTPGEYPSEIIIPANVTYNGKTYNVTSIGEEAFRRCFDLTSIELPNSLTSIGNYAFCDCSSLTSIELPNSLTSIGNYAFSYCTALTSIELPNSLTSIGEAAFWYCSALTSIELPNSLTSIGNYAFCDCSSLTSIELPNSLTSLEKSAFSGCSSLTSIELPNSLTSIGEAAFWYCSSLTSIELPNSLTSIGEDAFHGCSSLTSIELPNSLTSIGEDAFSGCSALTSLVVLGKTPPKNEHSAFDESHYYETELYVPHGCRMAYKDAYPWSEFRKISEFTYNFVDNGIYYIFNDDGNSVNVSSESPDVVCYSGDIIIPESVTYNGKTYAVTGIERDAFRNCKSLNSVYLPNTIGLIEAYAFTGSYFTSLFLGKTPPKIFSTSFDARHYNEAKVFVPRGCRTAYENKSEWYRFKNLSELNYDFVDNGIYYIYNDNGNSVSVASELSDACSYSGEIIIPESVTYNGKTYDVTGIAENAFKNGKSVTSVSIPSSVDLIDKDAFSGSGLTTLTLRDGKGMVEIKNAFEGCDKWTTFYCGRSCKMIPVGNNTLTSLTFGNRVSEIIGFNQFTALKELKLPSSIISINGFDDCSGLTELIVPASVTNLIGFHRCENITRLTLKDGAKELAFGAFLENNIETLYLGRNVDKHLFSGSQTLTSLQVGRYVSTIMGFSECTALETVSLTNGLTSISDETFASCASLKKVVLPNTIVNIGARAFFSCESLEMIILGDGLMDIGEYAFAYCMSLKEIDVPGTVPVIKNGTFCECTGLEKVTMHEGTILLLSAVFENCRSLKEIHCDNPTAPEINKNTTFNGVDKKRCRLHVPDESIQDYIKKWGWSNSSIVGTSIDDVKFDYNADVMVSGNSIIVDNLPANICVALVRIDGQTMWQGVSDGSAIKVAVQPNNVYVLKIGNTRKKISI